MIIAPQNESVSHIYNTNAGVHNFAEAKIDSKASFWGNEEVMIPARNESASHICNTNAGVQNVAEAKKVSKASGWGVEEVIKSGQNGQHPILATPMTEFRVLLKQKQTPRPQAGGLKK